MLRVRRSSQRGHANHGWLDTYHSFSFGDYYDPAQMGFRALRVINEDRIAPGKGFGTHGHRDMEIVTYVLEGQLEHRDSMGNGEILHPGEFQRMSAGSGIQHSEFNPSTTEPVHLYQIWLLPQTKGITPRYAQKAFPEGERWNQLRRVASPQGEDGSLSIHQNAEIFLATLEAGHRVTHVIQPTRHVWLQILRGEVSVSTGDPDSQQTLQPGDAVAVSDETALEIAGIQTSEILMFDLE